MLTRARSNCLQLRVGHRLKALLFLKLRPSPSLRLKCSLNKLYEIIKFLSWRVQFTSTSQIIKIHKLQNSKSSKNSNRSVISLREKDFLDQQMLLVIKNGNCPFYVFYQQSRLKKFIHLPHPPMVG